MRRVTLPALAIYTAVLVVAIIKINPSLVGGARPERPNTPLATFGSAPFRGRIPEVVGEPSFIYRGGNARTGFDPSAATPRPLSLVWQYGPVNQGIHAAAKSSPAVDDTGIYVGADTGDFYALDLGGAPRWSFHVDNAPQGIHATAALDRELAYFGDYKGRLFALHKDTGDLAWANQLGETIGSSVAVDATSVYASVERNHPFDGFVARLDRRTGRVIWFSDWLGDQSHASPTLDATSVYVGANNGILRALSIDSGRERWQTSLDGAIKSTAVLVGKRIYVTTTHGSLYAVETETGRVAWRTALSGTAKGSASYVPGDGTTPALVVVGSNAGTAKRATGGQVQAVRIADGSVAWTVDTDLGDMRASPTIVRGPSGYVAWTACGEHAICAFSTASGAIIDRLALPATFTGTPTFHRDRMYLTLFDGGLLAFGAP
jgi:outer membrane protein assembly factor BamB